MKCTLDYLYNETTKYIKKYGLKKAATTTGTIDAGIFIRGSKYQALTVSSGATEEEALFTRILAKAVVGVIISPDDFTNLVANARERSRPYNRFPVLLPPPGTSREIVAMKSDQLTIADAKVLLDASCSAEVRGAAATKAAHLHNAIPRQDPRYDYIYYISLLDDLMPPRLTRLKHESYGRNMRYVYVENDQELELGLVGLTNESKIIIAAHGRAGSNSVSSDDGRSGYTVTMDTLAAIIAKCIRPKGTQQDLVVSLRTCSGGLPSAIHCPDERYLDDFILEHPSQTVTVREGNRLTQYPPADDARNIDLCDTFIPPETYPSARYRMTTASMLLEALETHDIRAVVRGYRGGYRVDWVSEYPTVLVHIVGFERPTPDARIEYRREDDGSLSETFYEQHPPR